MLFPYQTKARTVIDLSGIWSFRTAGEEFDIAWTQAPLENALTMAVPGSYNDQKDDLALRDHYGWVMYQRVVAIPQVLLTQRLMLRFEAVTHHARVYLNGVEVCRHKGGFLPFEVQIDGFAHAGNNLLTVACDNRIDFSTLPVGTKGGNFLSGGLMPDVQGVSRRKQNHPNFDFFNYAGLHRPVKLYTTPQNYIADVTLIPDVQGTDGILKYQIETVGTGEIHITVRDEQGYQAADAQGAQGTLTLPNAHLWQPSHAYLYTVAVDFAEDCYEQPCGIRTVKVQDDKFLINDKPFYFKGFGKHEDSNIHGRGLDECLNVKDLSLMHWIGANSFRTAHYPYSEEMMQLCDREGIVVIDEVPAVGVNLNFGAAAGPNAVHTYDELEVGTHHHEVIQEMIARDKNYACVVMWSIGNESDTTTHPEEAVAYYQPLYELAHHCDPQARPVTLVGLQNDYRKDKIIPMMDVICLNRYYGWYIYGGELDAAEQALRQELSYWCALGKPVMFTEYGADTVLGLRTTLPTMFTEEYQVEYYRSNHKVFDEFPAFIGEQTWNFADFQTSMGIMRVEGNKKGIFTRDRRPKLAAHALRQRWTSIPDFGYKA